MLHHENIKVKQVKKFNNLVTSLRIDTYRATCPTCPRLLKTHYPNTGTNFLYKQTSYFSGTNTIDYIVVNITKGSKYTFKINYELKIICDNLLICHQLKIMNLI